MSNKIYGFYFAALINKWEPIVQEQITKLYNSELYKKTDKLFIRVFYENDTDITKFLKIIGGDNKIILSKTNKNEYEFGVLKILKEESKKDNFYCYYFHAKGVSKLNGPTITSKSIESWRQYMEYFLIDKHELCINELNLGSDAVGVKLRTTPSTGEYGKKIMEVANNLQRTLVPPTNKTGLFRHFSGNFWWSKSEFIKTLPEIDFLDLSERHHAEFWVGYTRGNLKCIHDSNQAGYRSVITENYKS